MEGQSVKILIIDDEESFCRPMEVWLRSKGYETASCESGEKALSLIKNDRPTIVFLDLVMPKGLNGLETLQRLREIDKYLPVIVLTAYGTDEAINEAMGLGIDGFFPKSEKFDRMYILIQAVLDRLRT